MPKLADLSNLASTYIGYRNRAETCAYQPTRIWIEPTSHCNLRCDFCGNKLLPDEQRGFMGFDLFRRIVGQIEGEVRRINLFHRGESLLHPEIVEMVRYTARRDIRTRIHTNGMLLTEEVGRQLMEAGLDILSFSFDGYDKRMYEANRPGASFDRVLGNIYDLLLAKNETGARKPFVAIELMEISDLPESELRHMRRKFLSRFDGLPLDKFVIRKPHNWAGFVDTGVSGSQPSRLIPCPLPWHAMVVYWDGRVLPCPQDIFGALQIGDACHQPLMEIWNSKEMRELRKEMVAPQSLARKPCVDCDRIRRATFAGVPVDYLGRFLSETVFGNSWPSRILPH